MAGAIQHLSLHTLAGASGSAAQDLVDAGFSDRMWSADHTLWVPEPAPEIADRLGWLDLPETMQEELAGLIRFADEARADGIDHVLLMGMGGSSLAPEVFARTFAGDVRLSVLDSTHPDAVASLASEVVDDTLFIVASKSGTTIEPLSFLEFFWDMTGGDGDRFVAITDPGTPLAEMAVERGFRRLFEATPTVGGRYSALTHFGLVPAAVVGAPIGDVLASAAAMRRAARSGESDPLALGAALAVLAMAGRDKATFLCSPSLSAFPSWVEQLIAESTGKSGVGIVPIAGETAASPATYGDDRVFIYLAVAGDSDDAQAAQVAALEDAGAPVIRIKPANPTSLGAEMYRAEFAVAAAGSRLGIHPFNQPDVEAAKELAKRAMTGADIGEAPVVSGRDALGAAEDVLATVRPGDYIGLLAFLQPSSDTTEVLDALRHHLRHRTGAATTLGFGPRYLHSTGQLHKGGPNTGVFIEFIDAPQQDLAVPGADYSFGDLIRAQATGDHAALLAAGRRIVRIDLGGDVAAGLSALAHSLGTPGIT